MRRATFRALVCEDEADLRELIADVLRSRGHEVELAATGEQALERLAARPFDLLVLDVVLPGISGFEVLAALGSHVPRPRAVVMTGRTDYGTFARAVRGGAEAYVVKPFELALLVRACESLLERVDEAGSDRRAARRLAMGGSVRVFDAEGGPLTAGSLVDLSPGGAQVELDAPLEASRAVVLAVDAETGLLFDVEGRVAWRGLGAGGFAHGVGFVASS